MKSTNLQPESDWRSLTIYQVMVGSLALRRDTHANLCRPHHSSPHLPYIRALPTVYPDFGGCRKDCERLLKFRTLLRMIFVNLWIRLMKEDCMCFLTGCSAIMAVLSRLIKTSRVGFPHRAAYELLTVKIKRALQPSVAIHTRTYAARVS